MGTLRIAGLVGIMVALILAGATLMTSGAPREGGDDVREILLVARGMTYYLDDGDTPNPELRVRAGERVRIRLRNEDAGMAHDFAIAEWEVATRLLQGRGEEAITFSVPAARGEAAYQCTPHAQMMRGTIIVE
jgi:FtsP/CotA-like multicopper oxidase with cupredoxin domain